MGRSLIEHIVVQTILMTDRYPPNAKVKGIGMFLPLVLIPILLVVDVLTEGL